MGDKNINEFVDKNNIEVKSALKDKKGRGFNKSFRPNQAEVTDFFTLKGKRKAEDINSDDKDTVESTQAGEKGMDRGSELGKNMNKKSRLQPQGS